MDKLDIIPKEKLYEIIFDLFVLKENNKEQDIKRYLYILNKNYFNSELKRLLYNYFNINIDLSEENLLIKSLIDKYLNENDEIPYTSKDEEYIINTIIDYYNKNVY